MQGVVKVYDPVTGVGIIVREDDRSEVLLQPGSLRGSLFRTLTTEGSQLTIPPQRADLDGLRGLDDRTDRHLRAWCRRRPSITLELSDELRRPTGGTLEDLDDVHGAVPFVTLAARRRSAAPSRAAPGSWPGRRGRRR